VGVVNRQGGKHSLLRYIGVGIGAISTLFIYPLNRDLYGFAHFLIGTAFLLHPLLNLGVLTLCVKFFPRFESKELQHAFLNKLTIYSLALFTILGLVMLLFKPSIIHFLSEAGFSEVLLLDKYYKYILVLTLTTIMTALYRQQSMNYKRIVIPTAIVDFGLKIFLPVAILISLAYPYTYGDFAKFFACYQTLIVIGLLYYLYRIGAFSWVYSKNLFQNRITRQELTEYSLFASLSRIGTVIAFRIDAFMITLMLGAASNGLYYIMLFIANTIQIPFQSLSQISAPIIARAWEKGEVSKIEDIYKKSALILMIVVLAMFGFLYFSLPSILSLSPKGSELMTGVGVFLFLGLARVSDSLTSVNEPILNYSSYYKYNLVFVSLLAVLNIGLNYVFIQEYGLIGAAIATFLAYTIFNLAKMTFILFKSKIHPFSSPMFMILLIGLVSGLVMYFLPEINYLVLDVALNGIIVLVLFLTPVYFGKYSSEFNQLVDNVVKRVRKVIG